MPRHSIPRMGAVSLVAAAWLATVPAAEAQTGTDRAMDLYRRQVQAREKKRQEMIERLAALPQPAPPPRAEPGMVQIRGYFQVADELFDVNLGLTLEPVPRRPEADADDDTPPRPAPQRPVFHVVAEENFDRWLFGNVETEDLRRAHLDRLLAQRVDQASMEYRLTPAQADKLRLAGRGDIKRFFDAVEERRRGFDQARADLKAGIRSLQGLRPLIADFERGPFAAGSIYHKTLNKILNDGDAHRRPR